MTDDNQYEFAEDQQQGVVATVRTSSVANRWHALFKSIGDYGINSGFLNKVTP